MESLHIERMVTARVPTPYGEYQLSLYHNNHDDKEHVALIHGDVRGGEDVLTRIHSECFTGDLLGSLRCDCGDQLARAMREVGEASCGVILYLRQEGRGIGLLEKLRAYNLQDEGLDTVAANRELGFAADARDYTLAALMLADLEVGSIRLMTNNPAKIAGLERHGIDVRARVPIPPPVTVENAAYLRTKALLLDHLLDPDTLEPVEGVANDAVRTVLARITAQRRVPGPRPFVTLSWAQSVDGCIAAKAGEPLALSGRESLTLTHELRAAHDVILVGIRTVLADDPRLTVRLVESTDDPQPVVLDSRLRFPLDARLLEVSRPWIATSERADPGRQKKLEQAGAEVIRIPSEAPGRLSLPHLLDALTQRDRHSVMVEGGARVITSFLAARLADHLVLTVAPTVVGGGLHAVGPRTSRLASLPQLKRPCYHQLGDDLIVSGEPLWS